MSKQNKPKFTEQNYYLMVSQLEGSKVSAQKLLQQMISDKVDPVIKTKAAVILNTLFDSINLLEEIAEELKWEQR